MCVCDVCDVCVHLCVHVTHQHTWTHWSHGSTWLLWAMSRGRGGAGTYPRWGVSSHPSSLHHTQGCLAFALTRAVVSKQPLKWENPLKYHVADPCTTWWKWRGSSWSRAGSPPRASWSPLDTSGGPRSPREDPHSAGSFDAHRVEGLLGCPGLLCGCVCDYGTEQIPTLPAAAGLWSRADTKPSVFPEGRHCWWLDKYTHTHTHTHTESITSKVNQGAVTLSSENTPSVPSRGCMAQDRNGQRTQKYPDPLAFSLSLSSTFRCPSKEIVNHGRRHQRSHVTVPVDLPTRQFPELCALRCVQ